MVNLFAPNPNSNDKTWLLCQSSRSNAKWNFRKVATPELARAARSQWARQASTTHTKHCKCQSAVDWFTTQAWDFHPQPACIGILVSGFGYYGTSLDRNNKHVFVLSEYFTIMLSFGPIASSFEEVASLMLICDTLLLHGDGTPNLWSLGIVVIISSWQRTAPPTS